MITKVESVSVIEQLTLWNANEFPLSLQDVTLKYLKAEARVIECRLNFAVSLEIYETIIRNNLFNLQPEIKGASYGGNFLPQYKIELEISLKPDLLATLLENGDTQEAGIKYLVTLNQQQLQHISQTNHQEVTATEKNPLFNTESWLCLAVKQIQDTQEVGFKTFWNYVNFSNLESDEAKEEAMAEGVFNFIKDYAETNLLEVAENTTKDIISSVNNAFAEILTESFSELETDFNSSDSLFDEVVDFFEAEGWSFIKETDHSNSNLRLQHRGKNGQWKCLAIVREKEQEFIFYSICPLTASAKKTLIVAELITRINYGLTVGNFDLDFATGTIRYKTSVSVKGDYFSEEIIGNLVKNNVATMDKYLPEIVAVIE